MNQLERDLDLLRDMLIAAQDALSFVHGMSEEQFQASRIHQNAVIRSIEIIGEAGSRVSPEFRNAHAEINWRDMTGMRNRLIHGYKTASLAVVWATVQSDLPELAAAAASILKPR